MSVRVQFVGGAGTVTGSRHLVHTPHATVLLDCGLFQGRRAESRERNEHLGFEPSSVDAVVLSHAHIDHSGALPLLCRKGYSGPVYATPATRDLCAVMLEDSARIQAADARYLNRAIERDGIDAQPISWQSTASCGKSRLSTARVQRSRRSRCSLSSAASPTCRCPERATRWSSDPVDARDLRSSAAVALGHFGAETPWPDERSVPIGARIALFFLSKTSRGGSP